MKALVGLLIRDETGQDLIEYALLAAFISLAALAAITTLGTTITGVFTSINDSLPAVP